MGTGDTEYPRPDGARSNHVDGFDGIKRGDVGTVSAGSKGAEGGWKGERIKVEAICLRRESWVRGRGGISRYGNEMKRNKKRGSRFFSMLGM